MKNKNILILGGTGFIGYNLSKFLSQNPNNNITIADNLSRGNRKLINKKTKFIKADVNNLKKLKKVISENNVNTVIHLGGLASVAESLIRKKKYYINNVLGTLNVIKACNKSNVKNFIYSSSCSV